MTSVFTYKWIFSKFEHIRSSYSDCNDKKKLLLLMSLFLSNILRSCKIHILEKKKTRMEYVKYVSLQI